MLLNQQKQYKYRQEIERESVALSPELFLRKNKNQTKLLFNSENLSKEGAESSINESLGNLAKLVHFQYPQAIYVRMLRLISNVPDIIFEEESNHKVKAKVKRNPLYRFSLETLSFGKVDLLSFESNKEIHEQDSIFSKNDFSFQNTTCDSIYPSGLADIKLSTKSTHETNNTKILSPLYFNNFFFNAEQLDKIVKIQRFVKATQYKRNFFKMIRMNQYIEHKRNYLRLKRSLAAFDKKYRRNGSKRRK